jgi:tetratricopeptide (TPR) repeat protein
MKPLKSLNGGVMGDEKIKEMSISNSTDTISPSTHTSTTTSCVSDVRIIQNFRLIWLDSRIDEVNNDDSVNIITKLRQVVNAVNKFTDVDKCIEFITNIENEKIFMICSGELGQTTVPIIHDMAQINCVYIFCKDKPRHAQWTKEWFKVKGVYTDITQICEALKQATQDCDQNSISISFVKSTDETSNQNLDQLDQSFMNTQILKEILLTIDFEQQHIDEFLTYYREQTAGNIAELGNVEKIRKEYRHHQPIWWYTYSCFFYSMLNRALRLMEVDLIIKMGFFLRDLHNHIAALHSEQYGGHRHLDSFTVYRGQSLSQTDFDQLMKTTGGLMSFNNFLSTSLDRAVSLAFAESSQDNPDLKGILFAISINPSISSSSFANLRNVSYYQGEEEIFFSMHSVFRIEQVKQIDGNNRLWQVDLTLTSDKDLQLQAITEYMREETIRHLKGWHRLGILLVKLGQFDKAQQVFDIMLDQTSEQCAKANIYHMIGIVKTNQGEFREAIEFYQKSLEIKQKTFHPNDPNLATSYNGIGLVYGKMGDYSKALSYHEKAVEIEKTHRRLNDPLLANSYNNIGVVYSKMGDYSKALLYHEKSLAIKQKILPPNCPGFANLYNNIGFVSMHMGDYSKALLYHEKASGIQQKTLSANHPDLATSYNNIGAVYEKMGDYSKALSYYEKSLEIYQKTLSANHPDLANSYNNIGAVYGKMGDYSNALSYHEKALEIYQNILPENHSSLATSYSNIGMVYYHMGDYSKALLYHEKASGIKQKTLSANHPDLTNSYNNIGAVYGKMGDYSKALSYHEKALEIYQKTLSANHPSLATSYNNIGLVYDKMGDYSNALSYHEKALEIYQNTLPTNHPDIGQYYSNIGMVYYHMGDYSKALLYHEKSLAIKQKTLSANHPDLANSYNNIGSVYDKIGDYSKAHSYYERALNIFQILLSPNHPSVKTVIKSIEIVKKKL